MRNPLIVLGSLVATTTVAAAEPPTLTASIDAPDAAAPQTYVGVGVMAGGDLGVDGQLGVEGGYRLDRVWWVHGLAATGVAGDDQGGGAIHQARLGIEARSCTTHAIACAYAGGDVGYQTFTWRATSEMSPNEPHHDMIGVARAGFDVGGRHVRLRPGIETYHALAGNSRGVGALSVVGINLGLGVAYQW